MMSRESTVDMMAASGPPIKIPARSGCKCLSAKIGIILSPTSISGSTAMPITPTKCIPSIKMPTTDVPIIIARCIAFVSRKPMQRTVVAGSPKRPTPTSTQNDRINGFAIFPPASGASSAGLRSPIVRIIFSIPPPFFKTMKNKMNVASSITKP